MPRFLLTGLALLALLFFLSGECQAGLSEERGTRNVVSLIPGLTSLKEENLHSKVHSAPSIRLGYKHLWLGRNLQQLGAQALYCRPKTGLEDLNASILIEVDFAYSNGFPVYSTERSALFVGPAGRLHYSLCYYPEWDDSHLYWGDFLALSGKVDYFRQIRENRRFIMSAGLPLVSVFSRPDARRLYKIDDVSLGGVFESLHKDMRFGWWVNVLYLDLSTGYQFSINPRVQHTVLYSLNYARVKDSDESPVQTLTHSIGLEVGW